MSENHHDAGAAVAVAAALEIGTGSEDMGKLLGDTPPKRTRTTGVARRLLITSTDGNRTLYASPVCPTNKVWEIRAICYTGEANANMPAYIGAVPPLAQSVANANDYLCIIKAAGATAAAFARFVDSQAVVYAGECVYAPLAAGAIIVNVVEFDHDTWYAA